MPVDFTAGPSGDNTDPTNSESGMFAPTPTWERTKKRRGFGSRAAPERRSFFSDTPEDAALTGATAGAATGAATGAMAEDASTTRYPISDGDTGFAASPTYADRRTTVRKSRGSAAPVAIAAGLIVLAGVAAAGWYASRPHDTGVAQLTPGGAPATVDTGGPVVSQNGAAPTVATTTNAPMPAAPPARASRATAIAAAAPPAVRHRTVTTRRAESVDDVGVNASATVATPRPAPAPMPQAAPVNPAPVTPAPTQAAPATPPAADQPAPTQTAPTAPPTPPQSSSPTPPPDQPPPQ